MPNVELLNIDCMEYMAGLPDKAFDLAIVDPPYGIDYLHSGGLGTNCKNKRHNRKNYERKNWDLSIPTEEYFKELYRVSREQIIWGGNYFVEYLKPSMGWIVWYKGQEGLSMSDCELAFSSFSRATRVKTIFRFELSRDGMIHPTQKPVKLYNWLLHNYAKEGDKILDTHLGSGSSAIAAHKRGFDFVGTEIDKDYYDAACKRFKEQTMQQSMF